MIFRKIGLAVTFSPNGKALLQEAGRLKRLFDSKLFLIHVGEKTDTQEEALLNLVRENGINPEETEIIWKTGEPAKSILQVCAEKGIELLIAGALEKEKSIKYYIGSIARKIMREASCSVLIKIAPKIPPLPYNHICVSALYTAEGEDTIRNAYELAQLENADKFVLLKEFQVPGLAMTVYDSGSMQETEQSLNKWRHEENDKLELYARELNLKGIPITTECLYGKDGYEAGGYAKKSGGDLLVITGPKNRLKFFDRIFQHDQEFLYENIPCDLLIFKPKQ